MKTSKINKKVAFNIIFILMIFLFTTQSVFAIGVVPASKEYLLDNNKITYSIRLVNDEFSDKTYELEVAGDLAQYITLNTEKISFNKNEKYKEFIVNVDIPESLDVLGGEYVNRITIKESATQATNIAAKVGVVSKLTLVSPYKDASLKSNFITPNFIKDQQNSFSLEVKNEGIKDAKNCRGLLSIQSNTNTELDLLIHEPVDIKPGYTQRYLFPWKATLNNGDYYAKATVICDGLESIEENKFNIGSPSIKVLKLVSDNFKLGQINKFDLILESEWNSAINNVYADISLTKDKSILQNAKTPTSNFEKLDTQTFPLFIDTTKVEPGTYEFMITIHYLEKETIELFNLLMTTEGVKISSITGNVIGNSIPQKTELKESGEVNLLTLLIIVVVLVNGFLFYMLIKKKK